MRLTSHRQAGKIKDHLMKAAKSMRGRGRDVKLGNGRNEGVKATDSGLGESARESKMTQ